MDSDNTNNPEEIEASPLSQLAIKFNHAKTERERNHLFMEIYKHYLPKIKKDLMNIAPHNREEFLQIYRIEVYNALRAWKRRSNFETYLYCYIKAVYRKFMNSIKLFKKDIEYCYMSEIPEGEEPTYEMIQEFYDDYME